MSYQSAYSPAEQAERAYIRECGEKLAETIVGEWFREAPIRRDNVAFVSALSDKFIQLLKQYLTELELAEWAAKLVGNMDFAAWQEEQEQ